MKRKSIRLRRWKVEVLNEEASTTPTSYIVIAVNELDARTIAFALDGGFSHAMTEMEAGHVELVKMYTRILEVSDV